MSFLNTLMTLFHKNSCGTDLTPADSQNSQLKISDKRDVDRRGPVAWTDDTELRALAQESSDGITNWVLASDMAEFYSRLDQFNETREDSAKIRMRLTQDASDYIKTLREKGLHKASELRLPENGPLVLEGEMLVRVMGPQSIGDNHMLFEMNGHQARAFYHADPMNTNINIQSLRGKWVRIEFGMDNHFDDCFLPKDFVSKRPVFALG